MTLSIHVSCQLLCFALQGLHFVQLLVCCEYAGAEITLGRGECGRTRSSLNDYPITTVQFTTKLES